MNNIDAACKVIAQEARDGSATNTIAYALGKILEIVGTDCKTYPMDHYHRFGEHGGIVWEAEQQAVAKELIAAEYIEDSLERDERIQTAIHWLASNITDLGS